MTLLPGRSVMRAGEGPWGSSASEFRNAGSGWRHALAACKERRIRVRAREAIVMKRIATLLALAALVCAQGAVGADAQDRQGPRHAQLRRQRHARRLRPARRAGQLDRARRRLLPRARGRDLQRSEQGQVRAADGQGPLHRAAVGRSRRAGAQHHLDLVARHLARAELRRRQLLRRPGLHGAQGAEGEFGARAQRRRRSACSRAPPPSSTSPTISAPTR